MPHPVPATPPPPGLDVVVARLRAAGCVFAEEEAALLAEGADTPSALEDLVRWRVAGIPLEHLLGWAELDGVRVVVGPGAFVPRRRTGLLVRLATQALPERGVLLELCCGVAALAAVVASRRPGAEVHAQDVDEVPLVYARRNLAGCGGSTYAGDLFEQLPSRLRGRVDVLVANAPYVPTSEVATMPLEAREHEPRVALDGGQDGLDVARRILAGASQWLAPGGVVLVETSRRQAPALVAHARGLGLEARAEEDDELDATALLARSPTGSEP